MQYNGPDEDRQASEIPRSEMMEITIDKKIGDKGQWAKGIERANQILELVGGSSVARPEPRWDLSQDESGKPLLVLSLNDPRGSVEARFSPDELRDSERL